MNKTKIEWVKNPDGSQGYTWNPITGCLNHVNGLCKGGGFPCYAYKLANGRLNTRYLSNKNIAYPNNNYFRGSHEEQRALLDTFYPRFWEDRLEEIKPPPSYSGRFSVEVRRALQSKTSKGIFVCDMSDLFGIGIPEELTRRVLSRITMCYQHRFYLLTKQPQNLIKFSPFPDNCWVGMTATNTEMLMKACSELEYPVQAKLKYISIEPFLDWSFNWNESYLVNLLKRADIQWLIIGAQTKPYKPPRIEWIEEVVRAADKAGIPVFLKDNLAPALDVRAPFIETMKQYTRYPRQEMPVG